MQRYLRNICLVLLVALCCVPHEFTAQTEYKKHRFMWFRFRLKKHPDAFNPYVKHGKSTHEVSRQEKREDDKAIKRARREYKKSIKRSARKRGG